MHIKIRAHYYILNILTPVFQTSVGIVFQILLQLSTKHICMEDITGDRSLANSAARTTQWISRQ